MNAPLHRRISTDLAAEIRSGAWPPGHRIPFEHELMARYGCARATANKAVAALAAQGLVERRRRAGSFVARPHLSSAVLEIPDIAAEIASRGQTYRWRLLRRRVRAARKTGEEMALQAAEVLELTGLHLANATPFAHEYRLINLAEVGDAAGADFTREPPGAWLLGHVAWSEARHEISAVNPPVDVARALQMAPALACLCVRRWTWRLGAGITFTRQLFPGDAYDLVATFTPGSR
jgi:GntR family histidine utilization transcriptional repressor